MERPKPKIVLVALVLGAAFAIPAAGLADSWTPSPLPSADGDSATGYPGYQGGVPAGWPTSYDTDRYPDSDSCQKALNDAINKVSLEILNIPASTTQAQHEFANRLDAAIKANGAALGKLRPICLRKPPGKAPIPVVTQLPRPPVIKTPDPRYAPLPLFCTGYSECTVVGKAFIDWFTSGRWTRIGSTPFSIRNEAGKIVRVKLARTAVNAVRSGKSLKIRVSTRARWAGPWVSTRKNAVLRVS